MLTFNPSDLGLNSQGKRNNENQNNNNRRNNNNNGNRNDNKGNRKDSNNKPKRENSKAILSSGMNDFERGTGERTFEDDGAVEAAVQRSEDIERAEKLLTIFLEDYESMVSERGNQVHSVIRDLFWDVCKVLTHYYENKYKPVMGQMNQVLDIVSTQRFASSLSTILTNDDIDGWNDGINNVWKDVMFVVSTVLVTSHGQMKEETISLYIDLLASNGLAGKDIDRIVKELGITKDLAVDLVTSIPVVPDDMNDVTLRQFYNSFMMKLMEHADENIDVLDRATQGKLFSFFFGKSKIALKAIGRMLAHGTVTGFKSDAQRMIYAEYLSMLSERLDAYEIKDIKYVLKFVADQKKEAGKDAVVLFGSVAISQYDSIRKAFFELINESPETKDVLISS